MGTSPLFLIAMVSVVVVGSLSFFEVMEFRGGIPEYDIDLVYRGSRDSMAPIARGNPPAPAAAAAGATDWTGPTDWAAGPRDLTPEQAQRTADSLRMRLTGAAARFAVPERLRLGEIGEVAFVIQDSVVLSSASARDMLVPGVATKAEAIRVGATVLVTATSANLDVTERSAREQIVKFSEPNEWRWYIKGVAKGPAKLSLRAETWLPVDGLPKLYPLTAFERDLTITVTPAAAVIGFLKAEWKWAFGLVPFAALLQWWKARRRRKRLELPDLDVLPPR